MTGVDGPWGKRKGDDGNRQHLTQAGVALDGSLIATGTMHHPIDENGYFPSPDAHLLRISRVRGCRIMRCAASREPSGFHTVKELGSELHLPRWLADLINRALNHGVKQPIHVSAMHQDGGLSDSTSTIKTRIQPLTHWVVHIDEDKGVINVTLAATLHATLLEEWNTSTANYWSPKQQEKLEVNFSADAIDRSGSRSFCLPDGELEMRP